MGGGDKLTHGFYWRFPKQNENKVKISSQSSIVCLKNIGFVYKSIRNHPLQKH